MTVGLPRDGEAGADPVTLLRVEDLWVRFAAASPARPAARGISFEIEAGECLAVIGESGSGKSQTFLAVAGLSPANALVEGRIAFRGQPLVGAPDIVIARLRGRRIGMVPQNPIRALAPHIPIGSQLAEVLKVHRGLSTAEAGREARAWLDRVRVPEVERRMGQYPAELSGGLGQRVMLAIAMCCQPDLLIADEPTSAFDTVLQREILDLLAELKHDLGTAMALISHDLGAVARIADRIAVMHEGIIVETGTAGSVLANPKTPYARSLVDAAFKAGRFREREEAAGDEAPVILSTRDLTISYPQRRGFLRKAAAFRAIHGVDLHVRAGEALGIVGPSGSGKSTLAKGALKLLPHMSGCVLFLGQDLDHVSAQALRALRQDLQLVFQNPVSGLDPRWSIGESVAEPLRAYRPLLSRKEVNRAVAAMLERVGLAPELVRRYPHELSGGQNQRAGIARAVILEPRLIICDEATSALDAPVRVSIVNLLVELQRQTGAAVLFISHDLRAVRQISHRILVLQDGRVVEEAPTARLFAHPRHPVTRQLLTALEPIPDAIARQADWPRDGGDLTADRAAAKGPIPPDEPPRSTLRRVAPGHFVLHPH